MPRKTRQEKIIADLRRQVRQLATEPSSHVATAVVSDMPMRKTAPVAKKVQPVTTIRTVDVATIKRDLRKTFIISSLAITLEFVLYLATK